MRTEVAEGIEALRRQFPGAEIVVIDDESGGARVIVEEVRIGARFTPEATWIGGYLTAQYPYADVYPIFIGGEVKRVDEKGFVAPVTTGYTFADRPAIQISRVTRVIDGTGQTAREKFLKVLHFLETMP